MNSLTLFTYGLDVTHEIYILNIFWYQLKSNYSWTVIYIFEQEKAKKKLAFDDELIYVCKFCDFLEKYISSLDPHKINKFFNLIFLLQYFQLIFQMFRNSSRLGTLYLTLLKFRELKNVSLLLVNIILVG